MMLDTWKGSIEVNGVSYDSIIAFKNANIQISKDTCVILHPAGRKSILSDSTKPQTPVEDETEVRITVRPYMTKPASPEFNFMAQWNDNKPMPMTIMQGVKVKETPGMVYMNLHGLGKPTICCYCCGKELTNPISRHYGVGPICLQRLGITNDINDVSEIQEQLVNIKWSGWIIKSAIIKEEVVRDGV